MTTLMGMLVGTLACAARESDEDASAEGNGTSDGSSSVGESASTGQQADCDPSDPDIGPAVTVTLVNQTDAPLYFTMAESCSFGSPFGIARGNVAISWVLGICESCADALMGLCACPGPCVQDSVVRVDAGGRYVGQWPGSEIFFATLTGECASEGCPFQCAALAQAESGAYVASAIASPMVECDVEGCDCNDAADPDGWCEISGRRTGGDISGEAAFAYPEETAVEIVFE